MPINAVSGVRGVIPAGKVTETSSVQPVSGADFKKLLFNELEKVNQVQADATAASDASVIGASDSIHEVKIAGMKAELTLEYAISVNNKAIEAYKELMRLQL